MTLLIIIVAVYASYKLSSDASAKKKEHDRQVEVERLKLEQTRIREEWKARVAEAKIETDRMIKIEREQQRQAKILDRHEEQLMKLEQRLTIAEGEIAFNREQRERLFALLEIEQAELDASVYGGKEWAKHQKKIISLENQIHTAQKRIDKAHMDKHFCESRMSA